MPVPKLDARFAARIEIINEELRGFSEAVVAIPAQLFIKALEDLSNIRSTEKEITLARVRREMRPLWRKVVVELEKSYTNVAIWAFEQTYQIFVDVLPEEYWTALRIQLAEQVNFGNARDKQAAAALFKKPNKNRIREIVLGSFPEAKDGLNWKERIQKLSKFSANSEETIAEEIIKGVHKGQNPRQVARKLRPILDGNKAAAERVARTEMQRVGNALARENYKGFESIVAGRQIIATLDSRTRPHHATRHGRMYIKDQYLNQYPGARSISTIPIVPDEPNCRCTESVVLLDRTQLFPGFSNVASTRGKRYKRETDVGTYAKWFNALPGRKGVGINAQKKIVGPRRYQIVADRLTRRPEYEDFIDPETGRLVKVSVLKKESSIEAEERRAKVNEMIEQMEIAIARQRFGNAASPDDGFGGATRISGRTSRAPTN